jgi:Cysteine-rich secretory protein family
MKSKFLIRSGSGTGHYTQVVWAESYTVGCGRVSFKESMDTNLYVCNYGPGGNIAPGSLYLTGEPASKCPEGTSRSKKYQGLCGRSNHNFSTKLIETQEVETLNSLEDFTLLKRL